MADYSDMPKLEREEPMLQWGGENEEKENEDKENEENIPPRKATKKNNQFDFKLNRVLNSEEMSGSGFRCLSAGQASSGRFKGGGLIKFK
jgi:hypothetical protein